MVARVRIGIGRLENLIVSEERKRTAAPFSLTLSGTIPHAIILETVTTVVQGVRYM